MGLGLFKEVDTVEEAYNALHSLVRKLKDSCLLLDGYDNTLMRMHDLVQGVAIRIACRDHHILSVAYGDELKEWPNKDFFERCTVITLPSCKIPRFPSVPWECPELKMFTLRGIDHDLLEIPIEFFKEMKVLKVLDLTNLCIWSLQSLRFLYNLRTLCLDHCVLEDIAMVGQLKNLEVLSFLNSQFKQLPREIAELIHLRLLDLTDCSELETVPPNVISSLTRLEDLRMRNSFNQWEAEQVIGERSNASLFELKYLSHLTALDIHIPDGNMLLANIFSSKLERYHIIVGDEWTWHNVEETFNTLKLKLTPNNNQLHQDLGMLLKRSDNWHLDLLEGVGDIVNQFDNEDFQQLKHLHVQNSAYGRSKEIILENQVDSVVQHFMNGKVMFS
ncbi:disease resistance protein At4g27190-like [Rosa chinensis]|uniref:disease resistance protein At4g27190-like n=1 Tax=Rosa chinensis TaxID=74649 RepID=UPI000D08BDDB|nr:disease resistance protein At4g27190-like [Rosa chinensis]